MATDQELLQAYLLQRDEVAFANLWRRHQGMVMAVARRIVGDPADAEDVTQEVFSELSRCAAEIESPAAWLQPGPATLTGGSGTSATAAGTAIGTGKIIAVSGVGDGLGVVGLVWATSVGPEATQPRITAAVIQATEAPPTSVASSPTVRQPVPAVGRCVQTGDRLLPDDVRGLVQLADGSLVIGQLQREPGAGLTRCRDGVLLPPLALPAERCANHGLLAEGDGMWAILAHRLGEWSPNATWQRELWQLQPEQKRVAVLDQVMGEVAAPAGGLGKVGSLVVAAVGDQIVACGPDGEQWRMACPGARELAHDRLRRADGSLLRVGLNGGLELLPGRFDFIAPAADDGLLAVRGGTLQELAADGTVRNQATTAEKGITGLLRNGEAWIVVANGVGPAGIGGSGAVVAKPGQWALRSLGWIDAAAPTADGRVLSTSQSWRSDGTFERWTVDGVAHPDDPRIRGVGSSAWHAAVAGHDLLLVGHEFGNAALFRFAADGIAIPFAAWMTSATDAPPRSAVAGWPAAY